MTSGRQGAPHTWPFGYLEHPLEGHKSFPLEGAKNSGKLSCGNSDTLHQRTECSAAHALEANAIYKNPREGMTSFPVEGVQKLSAPIVW